MLRSGPTFQTGSVTPRLMRGSSHVSPEKVLITLKDLDHIALRGFRSDTVDKVVAQGRTQSHSEQVVVTLLNLMLYLVIEVR